MSSEQSSSQGDSGREVVAEGTNSSGNDYKAYGDGAYSYNNVNESGQVGSHYFDTGKGHSFYTNNDQGYSYHENQNRGYRNYK